jgi:tRNA(Ile)-lysidine synthase
MGAAGMTTDQLQQRAFAAFDALLADSNKPNLVALSGGPDSTALLVLLARWSQVRRRQAPFALVVDHGRRPDSRAEAERVVVRWQGYAGSRVAVVRLDPVPGPSQNALRQARYAALTQACIQVGAGQLLTGHQRDDQVETLLERLSHGSNLLGLAGLARERLLLPEPGAPRLLRPLLFAPKADLIAFLQAEGLAFESDPSNQAPRYARTLWRSAFSGLEVQGLRSAKVLELAEACSALVARQEQRIVDLLKQHARWRDGWLLEVDAGPLADLEPGTRAALLSGLSQLVGWRGYPAALPTLAKLAPGQTLSLNRCLVIARKSATYVLRDPRCLADMAQGPWQSRAASAALRISSADTVERSVWPEPLQRGSLPHTLAKFAPVVRNSQGDWQLATKSVLALAPQFHTVDHSYRLVTSAMQLRFSSHA